MPLRLIRPVPAPDVTLTVTWDADLEDVERLTELASVTGRTRGEIISTAIRGLYRALHG
jgi:hypothetical protein